LPSYKIKLKGKKKMKTIKNKSKLSMIALFLMLTIVASSVAIFPAVNAQTATTIRSFFYVGVSPSTVGVGQSVIVVTWTADMPPDVGETAGTVTSPTGRAGWNNPATVSIMKPDGTNDTLTMPRTDPVGATWINYVPETVGTYVLQAYFPGEWKNSTTSRTYYTPDYSATTNLTVQQDPTPQWVETPLPADYWNRPLNSANHQWYTLAGNWLAGASQNYPQGTAGLTSTYASGIGPESAHILWTKQYYTGGLMDEAYGQTGYQTTGYGGINWNGIILNGKLHYTPRITAHGNQGWIQVDLYTGEQLSLDYNATRPSMGQIYNYESPNQHGGFPYLWRTSGVVLPSTVNIANAQIYPNMSVIRLAPSQLVNSSTLSTGTLYEMLDGFTGQTICYLANVSTSGTQVYGIDGSLLRYNLAVNTSAPQAYLSVWNSSAGTMVASQLGTGYWQWRPAAGHFGAANPYFTSASSQYNNVHDGRLFYSINVTIPSNLVLGTRNAVSNQTASIGVVKQDEYIVFVAQGFNNGTHTVPGFVTKLSLVHGQEGTLISKQEFTPPSSADAETVSLTGVFPEEGMILFHKQKTLDRFGYSMETGQLVWQSAPETQFHYYGRGQNYYNGTLLSYGYGGIMTAYDVKTGAILWTYEPTSIGTESAYGGNYPLGVAVIADGKLYTVTGEHSPTQPLYRGPNLRCIDATTGKEVWKILGFFGGMSPTTPNIIMADGILVGLNYYDNQLYAFGKGPSATTVTAQNDVSVQGNKVVVKGTVTDQTPYGRRNINDVLEFSLKDSPAISDSDMQAWMEYKFMQQSKPTNAKGVEVTLEAVDPNHNIVPIGKTTSDMNGEYGLSFVPEVSGDYQIIATFAGSKAYGPSSATTFVTVEDAPSATATPTPAPVSIADQYFVPATVGIILAIVVIGLVIILVLRKRP
jgi:hypothetical protein